MMLALNGVSSWVCNVCGHTWSRRNNYSYGEPLRCASCRTRRLELSAHG